MLVPLLDALSYLHAKNYVHAHLRPSNILVVENEVKLSADSILAEDRLALELQSSDLHNAPETATDPIAPPADIWSLGVTLVEALTQQLPVWDSAGDIDPVLPELPKPFDADCAPMPARRSRPAMLAERYPRDACRQTEAGFSAAAARSCRNRTLRQESAAKSSRRAYP